MRTNSPIPPTSCRTRRRSRVSVSSGGAPGALTAPLKDTCPASLAVPTWEAQPRSEVLAGGGGGAAHTPPGLIPENRCATALDAIPATVFSIALVRFPTLWLHCRLVSEK